MNARVSMKKLAPLGLVVVGLTLGMLGGELLRAAPAAAQSKSDSVPPENILSAGAQRLQMIQALNELNSRMGRVEAKLNGPLNVKVLEMPAIKVDAGK